MIFVTLGTQDKSFTRLLEAIENKIKTGKITDEVIVQAGTTKYKSKYMKIYKLLSIKKFEEYINSCDLLITHGGVGSILGGLKLHKKVIAAARLKKYDEHESDHQIEIVDEFSKLNYILKLDNFDEIDKVILKARNKKFKEYKSNNEKFVKLISDIIEEF